MGIKTYLVISGDVLKSRIRSSLQRCLTPIVSLNLWIVFNEVIVAELELISGARAPEVKFFLRFKVFSAFFVKRPAF